MAGKGSKRRKENYKKFTSNYDRIDWKKKVVKVEEKKKKC